MTLTNTLPAGVSAPDSFALEGTSVTPTYDSIYHRQGRSNSASLGNPVTLRYVVTIATGAPQVLTDTAEVREPDLFYLTIISPEGKESRNDSILRDSYRLWPPQT